MQDIQNARGHFRERRPVDTQNTMRDLRAMFQKWDVEMWEPIPDRERAPGVTLRYYRAGSWQQVHCDAFPTRAQNLRQVYLLLDRLRIAEKNGVSYTGLASTRDLVATGSEGPTKTRLQDAYFILGATPGDPLELIKDIYLKKATFYHPDKGGNKEKFAQLHQAYETICAARGVKP